MPRALVLALVLVLSGSITACTADDDSGPRLSGPGADAATSWYAEVIDPATSAETHVGDLTYAVHTPTPSTAMAVRACTSLQRSVSALAALFAPPKFRDIQQYWSVGLGAYRAAASSCTTRRYSAATERGAVGVHQLFLLRHEMSVGL